MTVEDELLKINDYLKCLFKMNPSELKQELNYYLTLIKSLEDLYTLHRNLINELYAYIERGSLSIGFQEELNKSYVEAIYEKAYLSNLRYIIKKLKANATNYDVYEIYMNIVNLNYVDVYRYNYITSIYNNIFSKKYTPILKEDNDDKLYDVSCSLNYLYKRLKYKKGK